MRIISTALLSLWLVICATSALAQAPSEHFGHLPMLENVTLSPDGENIAALFNGPDGPQVVVAPFGSRDILPVVQLKKNVDRIESVRWQNNDRLLIRASYSRAFNGDRVRVNRLFTVTKDGKGLKQIKQRSLNSSKTSSWKKMRSNSRILTLLPKDPDHILMELYSEQDGRDSVFKVNPEKNTFEKVLVNDLKVSSWFANSKGVINFGLRYRFINSEEGFETIFYQRNSNDKPFKEVYRSKWSESGYFKVEKVIGDKLYVISDREIGRRALWLFDIPSAKFEKLLFSHDKYDITDAIISYDEESVLGVRYADDYVRDHYFKGSMDSRQQFIDNTFKGYVTWNSGISKDQNRYIVAAQRNDKPTKYFWIDVKAKKGGLWFSQYPYLGKVKLGQTGAFSFKASDGMEIGGYLTMPVNAGDKKPKLIVHPHGGPRGRDYQYFNPWVQFMVNRGYAVLQVNFRGSTGFGSAFERAGYQQWGKAMQQDIYDAVNWVKAQDIVNTNESCLVGASYGGYVAMTAAFQKPDMFDCIVSIAGIPDLSLMVAEDYKWQSNHSWVEEQIGDPNDPKVAKEFFKLSAINNIDKIKAPILLIHGTYDTQVRVKQSKNFYNKARRRKMDVEYIEMDYGTHYLDGDDNRKAAFKAIDDFLAKHLK